MSLLGLYDFTYWPWDEDLEDEDDNPDHHARESLLIAAGVVSWSAAASVFDHSDD